MANLKQQFRWAPFAPDLGENLSLPETEQLRLEVANGLTAQQLSDLSASVAATKWSETEKLAEAFEPYVRVIGENTVNGKPLNTVADYFALVTNTSTRGAGAIGGLLGEVMRLNSVTGELELFLQRRSGGGASTGAPSVVKDKSPTGGR